MPPPETIEPLELFMFAGGVIAAWLAAVNIRSAVLDRQATRAAGVDGAASMWSNSVVWEEAMKCGGAVAVALIALIFLILPPIEITPWVKWLVAAVVVLIDRLGVTLLVMGVHGNETRRLLRESLHTSWDGKERRARQIAPPERERQP